MQPVKRKGALMRRPICAALAVALLPALLNAAPAYANPVGVPGPNPCGQIAEDRREVASLLENEFAYEALGDDAAACAPTLQGDNARCAMFTTAADAYAAAGALSATADARGYTSAQTLISWALAAHNYGFANVACVGVSKDKVDHAKSGSTSALNHLMGR